MQVHGTESLTLVVTWPKLISAILALGGFYYLGWSDVKGDTKEIQKSLNATGLRVETLATTDSANEKSLAKIDARLSQFDNTVMGLTNRIASVEQNVRDFDRRISIIERRLDLASGDLDGGFVIVPSKVDGSADGNKIVPVNPQDMKSIFDKLKNDGVEIYDPPK